MVVEIFEVVVDGCRWLQVVPCFSVYRVKTSRKKAAYSRLWRYRFSSEDFVWLGSTLGAESLVSILSL